MPLVHSDMRERASHSRMIPARPPLCLALALLALCAWAALSPGRAAAHGPGYELLVDRQPAGGYIVSVWLDPHEAGTDCVVEVTLPDGQLPPSLYVALLGAPEGGSATPAAYPARLVRSGEQVYYSAQIALPPETAWSGRVTIAGPAGSAELPLRIPAGGGGDLWGLACFVILLLGLVAGIAIAIRPPLQRVGKTDDTSTDDPSTDSPASGYPGTDYTDEQTSTDGHGRRDGRACRRALG